MGQLNETGLVALKAQVVLQKAERIQQVIRKYQNHNNEYWINSEIKRAAEPKWWGLVKGKTITRETAIDRLASRDIFDWGCSAGNKELRVLSTIVDMCVMSMNNTEEQMVYLSGKQCKVLEADYRLYEDLDYIQYE